MTMQSKQSSSMPVLTSETTVMAVIGDPIRHSKSPLMHNAALAESECNGVYTAFHVLPEQLGEAITGMRALGIRGMNVTIPHKEQVMAYLDQIDEHARLIGAVNTIVNDNGTLIGYNTDGPGYVRSLIEETGIDLTEARILMIGAGGAARGLAYALLHGGAKQLIIANRTQERAERIVEELRSLGNIEATTFIDGFPQILPEQVDVIINTTSIGMHPNVEEMPVQSSYLMSHMIVSDIIYNPLETQLLAAAKAVGARTHSGLGMFVYQGAIAFELWTGKKAPTEVMLEAVLRAMQK